jgi:cardiolipin synthase
VGQPVEIKPLLVSKLNTVAQILFATFVLGALAFTLHIDLLLTLTLAAVVVLSLLSIVFYLAEWTRHMNSTQTGD